MKPRRLGFKKSQAAILRGNDAAMRFLCGGDAPSEILNNVPDSKPRAERVSREGPVVAAISELLAVHPRVLWALRVNSGMASYEAKSGKYAPVHFHKWLRSPMPMRMPDFFGMMEDGRCIALEAKNPQWVKPTDQREREQADFLQLIRAHGGIGEFVRSVDDAQRAIERV